MKSKYACFLATSFLLSFQGLALAQKGSTLFKVVTTLAIGSGASLSAAKSAEAKVSQLNSQLVVDELRKRGIDPTDGALYSVFFSFDPNASGRYFTNPNVYALVQMEGQGDFIPASIVKDYRGQKWNVSFYAKNVKPGLKISVHMMDDRSFWNDVVNSIVQGEYEFSIKNTTLVPLVNVVALNGKIKLAKKDLVIEAPKYMVSAEITVPESKDGCWRADCGLFPLDGSTSSKASMGRLQFAQIWKSDISSLHNVEASTFNYVLYGTIALLLLVVFAAWIFTNVRKGSGPAPVAGV